MFKPNT